MPRLSRYNLESVCDKKANVFSALESISLILKIVSLLLLLILYKYFYVSISLWAVSIVVGLFKRNMLYKYVYSIGSDRLSVKKVYNDERSTVLEEIDLTADDFSVEEGAGDNRYYEKPTDRIITVQSGDRNFSLAVDDYFYSRILYAKRSKR